MSDFEGATEGGFNPARRRLCPDGACVGVIGPDGRCPVCGAEDSEAPRGLSADAFVGGCATEPQNEDEDEVPPLDATADASPAFEASRGLCPDGACVGVIGPDGRCKVCGLGAEG